MECSSGSAPAGIFTCFLAVARMKTRIQQKDLRVFCMVRISGTSWISGGLNGRTTGVPGRQCCLTISVRGSDDRMLTQASLEIPFLASYGLQVIRDARYTPGSRS